MLKKILLWDQSLFRGYLLDDVLFSMNITYLEDVLFLINII